MISITDLRIDYDRTCAVQEVSFAVEPGQVFGLIGPNGAGKTSTIRALAGLLEPTYGTVEVCGADVRDDDRVRTRIGFMPDFPPLYDDLLVWEFLDLFAASYGVAKSERGRVVDDNLARVGLTDKRLALVSSLSRGMRQRLMLAKTLLPEPAVLLLDEPASGLDPHGRIQLRQILRGLADDGRAVLVSSHILAEMDEFCSHVGIMERGRMVAQGTVDEIAQQVASGGVLAIEVDGPVEECTAVLGSLGLEASVNDKGVVEAPFDGSASDAADLLARLVAAGVRVSSFAPAKKSLEEVFLGVGAVDLS